MVKERPSKFGALARKTTLTAIRKFGRNDIIHVRKIRTKDSLGNVIGVEDVKNKILGDLQFVTYQEREILDEGVAQIGDGLFFAEVKFELKSDDIILVDDVKWKLTRLLEYETLGKSHFYQGWVAVRVSV